MWYFQNSRQLTASVPTLYCFIIKLVKSHSTQIGADCTKTCGYLAKLCKHGVATHKPSLLLRLACRKWRFPDGYPGGEVYNERQVYHRQNVFLLRHVYHRQNVFLHRLYHLVTETCVPPAERVSTQTVPLTLIVTAS